jgi:hypothetical protein
MRVGPSVHLLLGSVWRLIRRLERDVLSASLGSNRPLRTTKLQTDDSRRCVALRQRLKLLHFLRSPRFAGVPIGLGHFRSPFARVKLRWSSTHEDTPKGASAQLFWMSGGFSILFDYAPHSGKRLVIVLTGGECQKPPACGHSLRANVFRRWAHGRPRCLDAEAHVRRATGRSSPAPKCRWAHP